MLHWNSYILSNGYIVSDLRARLSPDNVNKLVFLARNANLYFEVMCVGGGGGGGGEAHVCCFSRYRCATYIRTCTYQLLTECQVPTFKDVSSVG